MFQLLPPAKIFEAGASIIAYIVTFKSIADAAVPPPIQRRIISFVLSRFGASSPPMLVTIEDVDQSGSKNKLYGDAMLYFGSKVRSAGKKFRISHEERVRDLSLALTDKDILTDVYQGVKVDFRYSKVENSDNNRVTGHGYIEIMFEERHKDFVIDTYLPYVEKTAAEMRSRNKFARVHTNSTRSMWEEMRMIHPSTWDTMAMDRELKTSLIADIDRFIGRKDYYKKVGKAWKRGYLLFGPPGTGKSSLVATISTYLNFDIYDLQLTSVQDDASLRTLLKKVSNGSILLVEDIDRSSHLQPNTMAGKGGLSMAGVLNCIDGVWSSCGEERIVIFTTNNKDSIDPALLRPGRMDRHIYMGYCGFEAFQTLALNYFDIEPTPGHRLFPELEKLLKEELITPAEVSEEFMKADDADNAMENIHEVLMKRLEDQRSGEM